MRLSDYVIKYLKDNYQVDTIFTVSGGGCIFLVDSLTNIEGVNYIATHHEQAAAIAAEGYSRMHNKLGACIVTSGPGGTNAITGVLGAWVDSIPMIVITGQVNKEMTTNYNNLYNLRQLGDQEFNIVETVKHMTKYAVQVNDPEDIKYHLDTACKLATSQRPGPVWLDIPLNVQSAIINPDKLVGNDSVKDTEPVKCADNILDRVAEELSKSKKPLLIVGNGIRLSGGIDQLKKFISKIKIPVISAVNGNDLINDDYKGYAGRFGTHAQICANNLISEADLVLSIGSRLYVRQTGYNFKGFAENACKIYVDVDINELNKPTLYPDIPVHSDAKFFLEQMIDRDINIVDKEWLNYCSNKYKETPTVLQRHRDKKDFVSHYHFVETLGPLLKPTDHVVTSDGTANVATMQVLKLKGDQRLITNTGNAPMGYGLPAAIGAASTRIPIVCIEGDGSLHLNVHELQTVKHYNLPIKIILFNNDGYTSIKISQKAFFNGKFVASEKNSGVSFPNFKKLINAYDLKYMSIENHSSMKDILKEFLSLEGPAVLEVFTDPEEFHEPKVVAKLGSDGKFIPGNLQDIKWIG
jgi:acetolactate synthase-1/2/3 large subunit